MIVPNRPSPSPYLASLLIAIAQTLTEAAIDHRSNKRFLEEVRVVLGWRPL
jgi:hypothetical protein